MSKLEKLYRDSLALAFIQVDGEGKLHQVYGTTPEPIITGDKPIYLSSAKRNADDRWHLYHPLIEAMGRPEAPAEELIRRYYTKATTVRLVSLIGSLIAFSENVDQHPNATPEQSNLLRNLGSFEANLGNTWTDVVRKVASMPTLSIMNVYCRNGAKLAGQTYMRGAIVGFAVYEQLKAWVAGGDKPAKLGVGSKKKAENLIRVFEYILPEISTEPPDKILGYSRGCNDPQGPRWVAFMRCLAAIQERINAVAKELGDFCFEADKVIVDLSWTDQLDRLGELRAEILSWNSSKPPASVQPAVAPAAAPPATNVPATTPAINRVSVAPRLPYVNSPSLPPPSTSTAPQPVAPTLDVPEPALPNRVSITQRKDAPGGLTVMQPGQYQAYTPPAPPAPPQTGYPMSPDGRFMYVNNQWVPAPPAQQQPQLPPPPTLSPDGRFIYVNNQWVPYNPQQQAPRTASLYGTPQQQVQHVQQNPYANVPAYQAGAAIATGNYTPAVVSTRPQPQQVATYQQPSNFASIPSL